MSVQKIKTKNKVSINNVGDYFIAREVIKFTYNGIRNLFIPIYYEYAFDYIDVEIFDEDGNLTGEFETVENIVKVFQQHKSEFDFSSIDYFFGLKLDGVKSTDDFESLITNALLVDTLTQGRYNTTEWELYDE